MNRWTILFGLGSLFIACGEKEAEEIVPEETEETATEETTEEPSDEMEDTTEDTNTESTEVDVCSLIEQESTSKVLPSIETEAAQLILIPDVGESYQLSKAAGAEGWFMLEVPSWMCDVEFYTTEGVSIELEASSDWELGDVAAPVSECEDSGLIRHSWTFHAWGIYVVHIDATDSTELWLATRLVSAGPG